MEANPRDQYPNVIDRALRMPELINMPALPISDVAIFLDIPMDTLSKLRAAGKGPRCFRLGRRLYVRQADLRAWLDDMATAEAA